MNLRVVRFLILSSVLGLSGCQLNESREISSSQPGQTSGSSLVKLRCDIMTGETQRTSCSPALSDQDGNDIPLPQSAGYQFSFADPKVISGVEALSYDCKVTSDGFTQICDFKLNKSQPVVYQFEVEARTDFFALKAYDRVTIPFEMKTFGVAPQVYGQYIPVKNSKRGDESQRGFQSMKLLANRWDFGGVRDACILGDTHFFATDQFIYRASPQRKPDGSHSLFAELYAGAPYDLGEGRLRRALNLIPGTLVCKSLEEQYVVTASSQFSADTVQVLRIKATRQVEEVTSLKVVPVHMKGMALKGESLYILVQNAAGNLGARVLEWNLRKGELTTHRLRTNHIYTHPTFDSAGKLWVLQQGSSRNEGVSKLGTLNLSTGHFHGFTPAQETNVTPGWGNAFAFEPNGALRIVRQWKGRYASIRYHRGEATMLKRFSYSGASTTRLYVDKLGAAFTIAGGRVYKNFSRNEQTPLIGTLDEVQTRSGSENFQLFHASNLVQMQGELFFASGREVSRISRVRFHKEGSYEMIAGKSKGSFQDGADANRVDVGSIESMVASLDGKSLYVSASQRVVGSSKRRNAIYRIDGVKDASGSFEWKKSARIYKVAELPARGLIALDSSGSLYVAMENEIVRLRDKAVIYSCRGKCSFSQIHIAGGRFYLDEIGGDYRRLVLLKIDPKESRYKPLAECDRNEADSSVALTVDSLGRVYLLEHGKGHLSNIGIFKNRLTILEGLEKAKNGCEGVRETKLFDYEDLGISSDKNTSWDGVCRSGVVRDASHDNSRLKQVAKSFAGSLARMCPGQMTGISVADSCQKTQGSITLALGMRVGRREINLVPGAGSVASQIVRVKFPCPQDY